MTVTDFDEEGKANFELQKDVYRKMQHEVVVGSHFALNV